MRLINLTLALWMLTVATQAQQATPPPKPPAAPAATPPPEPSLRGKLIYKPVGRGVPAGRVDAGSRGDGDEIASLYVLTPEEVGLTTSSQPSFFWFQTKPAKLPFEFSLLQPNHPAPVLRIRHSSAADSGFHRLDLKAHGVHLEEGIDYQWVVALIREPESRSRDIVSSGWIRHVAAGRIERSAAREGAAATYAASGIWYDAVTALFDQIAARPEDSQLRIDRQDLLTQVGLPQLTSPATASKRH